MTQVVPAEDLIVLQGWSIGGVYKCEKCSNDFQIKDDGMRNKSIDSKSYFNCPNCKQLYFKKLTSTIPSNHYTEGLDGDNSFSFFNQSNNDIQ